MANHRPTLNTTAGEGFRLLLVDDDRDIVDMFKEIIYESFPGVELIALLCPQEALRVGKLQVPDLIVTDQQMPGISGYQLIHDIRGSAPLIHDIIVSGYEEQDIRSKTGATCLFLQKPFPIEILIALIDAAICAKEINIPENK